MTAANQDNLAEIVARFNAAHPVGSKVLWERDNGTTTETTIRCAAEVRGQQAFVWLVGIGGPKTINSISKLPPLNELETAMLDALKLVLPFAEKELSCRELTFLPEPKGEEVNWLTEAQEAVAAIKAAIAKAEAR